MLQGNNRGNSVLFYLKILKLTHQDAMDHLYFIEFNLQLEIFIQ